MKYKVGDKVKVHTKEWFRTNCYENCIGAFVHKDKGNCYTFVNGMSKFCGQEITINQVDLDLYKYHILEDECQWNWEDWMFEDTNNNTNIIFNPNIVEDFAKLIGVELNEEFYDKESDKENSRRYKFTADDGLMVYNTNTESWQKCIAYSINTFFKMVKEGKFTKWWTPKDGDKVYFPDFMTNNLWNYKVYDSENEYDKEMLKSGLYFKTSEEAVKCAKKIIKNMKEG